MNARSQRGKRIVLGLLLALPALTSTGCFYRVVPARQVVVVRCRPDQYWDGYECRHKGRGEGARKHDGRWE